MRKIWGVIFATALMVTAAGAASATTPFEIKVFSNSTTNYQMVTPREKKINDTNAAIYVSHVDSVDTEEYTNHFRGLEAPSESSNTWTTRGTKWCTQGLNVPIQNNNIKAGKFYTVSARGNTNYYNYDGISTLWLYGTYNPNYPTQD